MTTLDHLHIRGYRRLLDVDLEMHPFTVMIGANGAGKTSFLEVLSLLAASANGRLSDGLSELGGISDILTRDKAKAMELELSACPVKAPGKLMYSLGISPTGQGYSIEREAFTQELDGGATRYTTSELLTSVPKEWRDPLQTALSQMPHTTHREPEVLRRALAATISYASLNVAPRSLVRLPQPMRPATLPGAQGEDLVTCLYTMRESDPDRFEMLEDSLAAGFPDFERLAFPPVAAGVLAMTWKDKNFSQPMYMHQLSEGTLRFLWLATLLASRDLPPITLLDEPEVSLHPELQSLLVQLMREASQRSQIIVATHSDRLVRFVKPEELVVVETEGGLSKFTWANTMEIDDWLADYGLDELWRTKRLETLP